MTPDKIVFLHGLGETPSVWAPVIAHMGDATVCSTPALFYPDELSWSLDAVTDRIATSFSEPVHCVGLSLGAVVALNLAIRHPQKVASLFLSAPQSRPPRYLMRAQSFLMKFLPASLVCPPGMSKLQMLRILDEVSRMNLDPYLSRVQVPATVVCGSKDRVNQPAARHISTRIPDARMIIVPGAGHQWHSAMPQDFAQALQEHLNHIRTY